MRAAEVEGWGMEGGRDEKKGAMLGKREEGEEGPGGLSLGGGGPYCLASICFPAMTAEPLSDFSHKSQKRS